MSSLPAHILLIEDDVSICRLLTIVLGEEGCVVTGCQSPRRALALLDRGGFDLVITDGFSTLPGPALTNTADVVRAAGVTPVVLFSGHTQDIVTAMAAGFRDLITKPFDLSTMVKQVKTLLAC